MALKDSIPDIGGLTNIPDMGAWQFVTPDGLRDGMFQNRPQVTGTITSTTALTGKLGAKIKLTGKFGADQS